VGPLRSLLVSISRSVGPPSGVGNVRQQGPITGPQRRGSIFQSCHGGRFTPSHCIVCLFRFDRGYERRIDPRHYRATAAGFCPRRRVGRGALDPARRGQLYVCASPTSITGRQLRMFLGKCWPILHSSKRIEHCKSRRCDIPSPATTTRCKVQQQRQISAVLFLSA
jgi:hypothetical protein